MRCAPLAITLAAVVALATGCSSNGPSGRPAVLATSLPVSVPTTTSVPSTSTAAASVPDPCTALPKADVQKFMSVPIATVLPQPLPGKACAWAGNDGSLGVATTITIDMLGGSDANDLWKTAVSVTSKPVMFSGVGDKAEHIPGVPDFLAIKGDLLCNLSTVGSKNLAGKADLPAGTLPTDAQATAIAQQYGTLCNVLFGSGNTTPTMTAGPPSGTASASPAGTAAPSGGTFAGSFPLPQGVACSGSAVTSDQESITCETTSSTDGRAMYAFWLKALPSAGFTISHESEATSDGKEIASMLFSGDGYGGFCSLSIVGTAIRISLEKE